MHGTQFPPFDRRRAGILMHATSLPCFATGTAILDDASRFLEFLAAAGFSVWQMLPIHPVDGSGSPYQSCSVHAGDARLLGMDAGGDPHRAVRELHRAFAEASRERHEAYAAFKRRHDYWLRDYARFRVLQSRFDGAPWWSWPREYGTRALTALELLDRDHAIDIEHYCFEQFAFFEQWAVLRRRAAELDIVLCGDMPIFSAHDSVETWTHPQLYLLDEHFQPTEVAGVPPDYFSATGQRWGNPLYDWTRMSEDAYAWWRARVRTELVLFDCLRLDHFRGFAASWHIPAACGTAVDGQWRPGPGRALFEVLREDLGGLPFIAEDLGIITPDVEQLRLNLGLPGMRVLQFAFDGGADNPYLPHNHVQHALVCTGTHDNDTTLGWFDALDRRERARVLDYLGHPGEPMPAPLMRAALASVACVAVFPMQDVLQLGSEHRMNIPGTEHGNWQWRFEWSDLRDELAAEMRRRNVLYGRS